jgi:adenylate cyclase class IV
MHLLWPAIILKINSNGGLYIQMAIETEKKYRLDKRLIVEITAKLREVGAQFVSEVFEENFLHRGGTLVERSAALRIRKTADTTTLTYKEKLRDDDGIKHKI